MKKLFMQILFVVCLSSFNLAIAQQWGLYTLYAPQDNNVAYLIDTANTPVIFKTWTFSSSKQTAYSTYLIPGDTIVRTYEPTGNTWSTGPCHGGFQKVTWNGTVVWDWTYYQNNAYCPHHDICPMSNGHILLICYEQKTAAEATQAGATFATSGILSEEIIEVKPTGATSGSIVWVWKLWDHLCQIANSLKDNYVTSLLDHPELLNINVGTGWDRFHMNGIDYNATLDQIVVSMHFTNEVYVIDHSTTTAQAATHTGGNSGKGGDFLYRWGKPANYGATGTTIFNVVHDAHWVPSDNPNYPDYLCAFNNKGGTGTNSAFTIWQPPYNGSNYLWTTGQAYTPPNYAYQYSYTTQAQDCGNSQQLPNGNVLMCIPLFSAGNIIELNSSGTILWSKAASSPQAFRYSLCYVRGPVVSAGASPVSVCPGDTVNLSSSATSVTEPSPTYTYSWSSDVGGFNASTQNASDIPSTNTVYTVTITNTAIGCSNTATVSVNIYPAAATPTVTENGGILTSSAASSYQWYFNGNIISGATSQNYSPVQNGNYQVEITDANGCSAMSVNFNFTSTFVKEIANTDRFNLYPNPTTGRVHLEGDYVNAGFEVIVYNTIGKVQLQERNISELDFSKFDNGIYFITIKTFSGDRISKKVILIR